MSSTTLAVFAFAVVAIIVGWPIYTIQSGKREIRNILKKKNARNIVVDFVPFTGDRSTYFYDVRYEDETGRFYVVKCKRYAWDSSIYWIDEDFKYK
jgi:hypothetical protein